MSHCQIVYHINNNYQSIMKISSLILGMIIYFNDFTRRFGGFLLKLETELKIRNDNPIKVTSIGKMRDLRKSST